jgi:hypothetical protein
MVTCQVVLSGSDQCRWYATGSRFGWLLCYALRAATGSDQKPTEFISRRKQMRSQEKLSARSVWVSLIATLLPFIASASPPSTQPLKVLFVGDSFTGSQGGIYSHFQRLAQSNRQLPPVLTDHVWVGGATLKRLWELGDAVRSIDSDSYDIVVIQDDIPEINVDYFRQYARMFVNEIRQHHARPVLYMTWAYERLSWISMSEIAEAHRSLAKELEVDVAPVGLAREQAHRERPDLDLFVADREHPSPAGMYLGTCVIYATVFGKDPTGLAYVPPEVAIPEAKFLQQVAWQAVTSWVR